MISVERILNRFPEVDFAFAYGSGVFRQNGYSKKEQPMMDFIFATEDIEEWHQENMKRNESDYSIFAKTLGTKVINNMFPHAEMYYNPFVKVDDTIIKYGVISTSNFRKDLRLWRRLYCAGRLHKPVKIIKQNSDLEEDVRINIASAANVALTLLPNKFSGSDFYEVACGLSYLGDTRIGIAENSHKVQNIVDKNFDYLNRLYIQTCRDYKVIDFEDGWLLRDGIYEHNKSKETMLKRIRNFPLELSKRIQGDSSSRLEDKIVNALRGIIKSSSLSQTCKGIMTAGPTKSVKYVWEKRKKACKKE